MKSKKNSSSKIVSFERAIKDSMGKKYNHLSKDSRQIIKEMSKCQETGGEIGSASIEHDNK